MEENLRYYERGRSVPEAAQKPFSNGRFSGTDINPMWRIKVLTEWFGPAGIGWYTEIVEKRVEEVDESHTMCFVDLNLYVKEGGEWSKPIFGTGGNALKAKGRGDDEGWKKAYTDALSIACKALGIGADIWFANDPTSKYTNPAPEERQRPAQAPRRAAQAQQQEPAPATPQRPTQAQLMALVDVLSDEQLLAMKAKYGEGLEKLSLAAWNAAVKKAKGE